MTEVALHLVMPGCDGPGFDPSLQPRRTLMAASPAPAVDASSVAADQLKAFIERIEHLEEEKAGIASDISDVYSEAKGTGFDVKALRRIISLRKKDHAERQEEEAILELYMQSLGMV